MFLKIVIYNEEDNKFYSEFEDGIYESYDGFDWFKRDDLTTEWIYNRYNTYNNKSYKYMDSKMKEKCEKYRNNNMCNKYCEMLQGDYCDKYYLIDGKFIKKEG